MENLSNQFNRQLNFQRDTLPKNLPNEIPGHYVSAAKNLATHLSEQFNSTGLDMNEKMLALTIRTTADFIERLYAGNSYEESGTAAVNQFYRDSNGLKNDRIGLTYYASGRDKQQIRNTVETIACHMLADYANQEFDLIPTLTKNPTEYARLLNRKIKRGTNADIAMKQLKSSRAAQSKKAEITAEPANKAELIIKVGQLAAIVNQLPILDKPSRSKTANYIKTTAQQLSQTAKNLPGRYMPTDNNAQGDYYAMNILCNLFADAIDKLALHINQYSHQYGLKDTYGSNFYRQEQAQYLSDLTTHLNKFVVDKLPLITSTQKEKLAAEEKMSYHWPIRDGRHESHVRLQMMIDKLK